MVCGSCGPKTLTVEDMKHMSSEQIIAAYRQGYKLVQGGAPQQQAMSQDWQYGDSNWQYGGIQNLAPSCVTGTKSSGDVVTLGATPSGAIGPYHVRFFRKSAPGVYTELGSVRTVTELSSTSTTIALVDADFTGAVGDSTAGIPTTGATGVVTDPENASLLLAAGKIRVATTTYDSCPTGAQSCIEYCDINLACVAPTCNFVVT